MPARPPSMPKNIEESEVIGAPKKGVGTAGCPSDEHADPDERLWIHIANNSNTRYTILTMAKRASVQVHGSRSRKTKKRLAVKHARKLAWMTKNKKK